MDLRADVVDDDDDDDDVEIIERPLGKSNTVAIRLTKVPVHPLVLREHKPHTCWDITAFAQGILWKQIFHCLAFANSPQITVQPHALVALGISMAARGKKLYARSQTGRSFTNCVSGTTASMFSSCT